MNAKDEQIAFSEWFDDLWLGDLEHGQHIPTIHDSGYDEYLEARQLALGAWMHRAQIAATNVSVEKSWQRFDARMIELERKKTSDAAPTPPVATLRLPEPMTGDEISDYARAMVKGDRSVDWLAMQIEAETLRRVKECNE